MLLITHSYIIAYGGGRRGKGYGRSLAKRGQEFLSTVEDMLALQAVSCSCFVFRVSCFVFCDRVLC